MKENKRDGGCKMTKDDKGEWKNRGGRKRNKKMDWSTEENSGREENEQGWMRQRKL